MKKAIVAGHICIDITPIFPQNTTGKPQDILLPGKLTRVNGAAVSIGGTVPNTGIAMHILGADVSVIGKIGRDDFGKIVSDGIAKSGIKAQLVETDVCGTSYSVVIAVPGTDRIFLHSPGVNDSFDSNDIDERILADTDLFHFGYPPLMRKMYIDEGTELIRILEKAKAAGTAVSLDMAAVDAAAEVGRANWKRILEHALPLVDFFVPSVEELCFMLDRSLYDELQERAKGDDITAVISWDEVDGLAKQCINLGTRAVMIKCGAPGLYYRTADSEAMHRLCERLGLDPVEWCGRCGFEESYLPDAVLSGTGAGDTSIAAFLVSVLHGKSLSHAVSMAAGAGACCVAAYDALSGLPDYRKLEERICKGWKKQHLNSKLCRPYAE